MNKYLNLIKGFGKHELVSGSFYVFIGTTVSSFLAFVLNIFFARELTYVEYGVLASLLSLVTLFTIPASSLSAVIVRYATNFFAEKKTKQAGALYKKSFLWLIVIGIGINVLFFLLFPIFSNFLKIDNLPLVMITAISVSMFYFATLNMSFIQSMLKFRLLGVLYSIAGVGKLVGGVVLILMGFNIYGAILATFIFSFIDFVFGLFPLRETIKNAGKDVKIGTRDFTSYAIPTSIAVIALSSFIASDVLLVKHFFSPYQAGLYGGLNLVGKVIFYFTGPIALAMFPLIVKRHSNNGNFNNLFYLSIGLVLFCSLLITAFYLIFPEFVLQIFLGGKQYLTMAPYLGIFAIFLTIFSLNNVFVSFFLSIKKTNVFPIVVIFAVMQIVLICLYHSNFYQIIYISIIVSALLLASLVIYYLKLYGGIYLKKK